MKKITTYQNKKVLVLGLAKSGVSAAKLLHELGALVTVNDAKQFDQNPDAQDLLTLGIRVVTGGHPIELLDEEFELIVKSRSNCRMSNCRHYGHQWQNNHDHDDWFTAKR